jgi:ACS family glucarate transporter-like MFS transporter
MLATALTPLLMGVAGTALGVSTGQWRYVFMLYASLGFVWALLFFRKFRETPDAQPACNASERLLIRGHVHPLEAGPHPGLLPHEPQVVSRPIHATLPLPLAMLLSPTMWLLCGISTFVNVGWIFLVTFLPTYLNRVHQLPLKTVGVLAALPVFAGMCGGMLGGIGTDLLVRRVGLVWGRRIPGLVATVGAGLGYLACLQIDNPYVLVVLFALVGLLIDFGLGSLWAVYQDIAGRQVAAVLGFANMCGNLAAGFFPMMIGWWADGNRWDLVFIGSASALFATASCWAFVNPQRKIAAD